MNGRPPNPDQNICRVTLDLPWEIAEALAEHGPQLIAAIQESVGQRSKTQDRRAVDREQLVERTETNKVEWAALALLCEREVLRRSNGKGQRSSIIKTLATELGHEVTFLNSVCKVFKNQTQKSLNAERDEQILGYYFDGLSNIEIGEKFGLAPGSVSRILASQKDKIKAIRAAKPLPKRFGPDLADRL